MSFVSKDEKALYTTVYKMIKNKKVTSTNIIYLAGVIMEVVEKDWSGDKKEITINILKEIVRVSPSIPEDQKEMLYSSIDFLAPGAIDLIVAGASGQLNINMPPLPAACGCFGGLGSSKQPPEQTTAKDLLHANMKKAKQTK